MLSWSQHYKCRQPAQGNRRDHNENDWLWTRSDELNQQYNEINKREGEEYPVEELRIWSLRKRDEAESPLKTKWNHTSTHVRVWAHLWEVTGSRERQQEPGRRGGFSEDRHRGEQILTPSPEGGAEELPGGAAWEDLGPARLPPGPLQAGGQQLGLLLSPQCVWERGRL